MEILSTIYQYVLPFLVILTVLVFVHEMGHYLIARYNGVRVEVFSIGFGREIFGWTDKAGTRWKFSLIPLGGYVKMFGDADAASRPDAEAAQMTAEERAVAFPHKRLSQRSWIVVGGPLANFIFAIVLYAGLFMTVGQPFTPAEVGEVLPDSAAEEAGFQSGDRVVRIDGRTIERFEDLQRLVSLAAGERLEIAVLRDGREELLIATPRTVIVTDNLDNEQEVGRLGISRSGMEFVRRDPLTAIWRAGTETLDTSFTILKLVGQMISGRRSSKELGGVIGIAQMSGQVAGIGLATTINFMAFLSISLGLINLFPIPILDGGHLLFYMIEALRGRPLGERAQEFGFRIGLGLVLSLMLFATWNDLVHRLKVIEF